MLCFRVRVRNAPERKERKVKVNFWIFKDLEQLFPLENQIDYRHGDEHKANDD